MLISQCYWERTMHKSVPLKETWAKSELWTESPSGHWQSALNFCALLCHNVLSVAVARFMIKPWRSSSGLVLVFQFLFSGVEFSLVLVDPYQDQFRVTVYISRLVPLSDKDEKIDKSIHSKSTTSDNEDEMRSSIFLYWSLIYMPFSIQTKNQFTLNKISYTQS